MFYYRKGYPLEKVEIACSQTGVYVLDETRTQVLGIPWLTVIQDVYSNYIFGIHLSIEEPSLKSMAHGLPETIICPKKYDIQPICNALGIQLDQNITRKMNRWFKSIKDGVLSQLPDNTLSTKNDKRFKPEKKAVLTLETLENIILLFLKRQNVSLQIIL